jgi:hypothetical protein
LTSSQLVHFFQAEFQRNAVAFLVPAGGILTDLLDASLVPARTSLGQVVERFESLIIPGHEHVPPLLKLFGWLKFSELVEPVLDNGSHLIDVALYIVRTFLARPPR